MENECTECHGSGVIVDEDDNEDECPKCDGTGVLDCYTPMGNI